MRCLHRSVLLARKKGGQQQAWTPSSQAGGLSPSMGLSGHESLNLFYRPVPLEDAVDFEQDIGPTMLLHREYVPKRVRDKVPFSTAPLAYSDLELNKAQEQLASQMNRERFGSTIVPGTPNDVPFQTDVNPESREVMSARYLFDDKRMAFCERFDNFFGSNHQLFSVMEASAVLFGCDNDDSKEAYLRTFLNLDRESMDDAVERLRACRADLADANKMIKASSSLLDDDDEAAEDESSNTEAQVLPNEFLEYAPLVKSYLSHAQGLSRTVSTDTSTVGSSGVVAEKMRWRQLLLKIHDEDYHKLSPVEMADAHTLNSQLHSVKFFDLKLGDVVREIVQLTQRSSTGGSLHGASQMDRSTAHPEGRSSTGT